jgi:hypothetical protein
VLTGNTEKNSQRVVYNRLVELGFRPPQPDFSDSEDEAEPEEEDEEEEAEFSESENEAEKQPSKTWETPAQRKDRKILKMVKKLKSSDDGMFALEFIKKELKGALDQVR